jgi:hypothetical protein
VWYEQEWVGGGSGFHFDFMEPLFYSQSGLVDLSFSASDKLKQMTKPTSLTTPRLVSAASRIGHFPGLKSTDISQPRFKPTTLARGEENFDSPVEFPVTTQRGASFRTDQILPDDLRVRIEG